jgi:hypothetical protein
MYRKMRNYYHGKWQIFISGTDEVPSCVLDDSRIFLIQDAMEFDDNNFRVDDFGDCLNIRTETRDHICYLIESRLFLEITKKYLASLRLAVNSYIYIRDKEKKFKFLIEECGDTLYSVCDGSNFEGYIAGFIYIGEKLYGGFCPLGGATCSPYLLNGEIYIGECIYRDVKECAKAHKENVGRISLVSGLIKKVENGYHL